VGGDAGGSAGAAGGPSYADAVLAATWTKLVTGPTVAGGAKQDDVFFVTPKLGYAASGPNFSIFKTEDGGSTWTPSFKSPGTYFRAVLFLDDQHGFAGNLGAGLSASIKDKNVMYETKDGGGSWLPVTTITGDMPSGLCNLTAIDAQNLIGVGRANGPAHLMRSSDGGATWVSTSLKQYLSMAIDARFASKDEGVVVGMGAGSPSVCTVIRTEDGGQSWNTVFASKTASSLCWKVHFPTATVGYVAVQDTTVGPGTFAKTSDGGKSWEELPLPPTGAGKGQYPAIGVGFITDKIGWMAPESASLPTYRTADGGQTWTVDPTLVGPINRFRFVDAKTAYAIGAAVWKLEIDWNGQ
jgi:photosystem II stability/assembly factor-like uncharacterized protein